MKHIKKKIILPLLATVISSTTLAYEPTDLRHTSVCPFLDSSYGHEVIGGEDFFVYSFKKIESGEVVSGSSELNGFYQYTGLSAAEMESIGIQPKNPEDTENYDSQFHVGGLVTHEYTLQRNTTPSFIIPVTRCDASIPAPNRQDYLLESNICSDNNFSTKLRDYFDGINYDFNEQEPMGNLESSFSDMSSFSDNLFDQAKGLMESPNRIRDTIFGWCNEGSYRDIDNRNVTDYCEIPTNGESFSVQTPNISRNIVDFFNENNEMAEVACSGTLKQNLKAGEQVRLPTSAGFGEVSDFLYGYVTVKCEMNTQTGTPELKVLDNNGNCNVNNESFYDMQRSIGECNNNICLFVGNIGCSEKIVQWGSGENKCWSTLPFAFESLTPRGIPNENESREGTARYICADGIWTPDPNTTPTCNDID